jgi:hypothetical protein
VAVTYQEDSLLNPDAGEVAPETIATGANRRQHVRVRPDERNRLTATLASGSDIRLIDLSKGGAQFECDRRFLPNATVSLRLLTSDGQVLVTGRVVRSRIVRLASGGLGYLVAVAFARPLQTDLENAAGSTAPPGASAGPVVPVTRAVPDPRVEPVASAVPFPPADTLADISAEEALAFESTIELAPAMLTVTASVESTSEQLHDMFDGNDW